MFSTAEFPIHCLILDLLDDEGRHGANISRYPTVAFSPNFQDTNMVSVAIALLLDLCELTSENHHSSTEAKLAQVTVRKGSTPSHAKIPFQIRKASVLTLKDNVSAISGSLLHI
jgi:hypothetical protein